MLRRICKLLGLDEDAFQTEGDGNYIISMGDTVPTDGTAGYAVGGLFMHRDGGAGSALYFNEGTEASCDFNAVVDASGSATFTLTAPTTAANAIYAVSTLSSNWTGSQACVRATATSSATGACGNLYAGRFESNFTAKPATSGHTTGLYVQVTTVNATNNPTSCFTICKSGAAGGATTPYIFIQDSSTTKSTILMDVGGVIGGGAVGTTSGQIYYNNTLRMKVNSDTRYIPLSTAEGTYTTAYPIVTTRVDPDAAYNGIYTSITQANAYSGSIAGVRSTVTCSATAGIGNMYGGRFELIQSAAPSSQGHTCGLYAQTTTTGGTNNPTSVLTLCKAGATGGATTPFINVLDAGTTKSDTFMELGTGNAVGSGTGAELFRTNVSISNVSELSKGIRIKVNGAIYYMICIAAADV